MAMFDSNIDYTKFIQFNGGTLRVATFVEIRDALVRRYKEIYGNDIDISTASADGQYINEIALIINNIVNTFAYAYDQLDPSVATGKYLDILCSYNNIQRINQSASIAELYVFNSSPAGSPDLIPEFLLFSDRSGQTWKWTNGKKTDGTFTTTFPAQKATLIKDVQCEYLGAIQAQGSQFIDSDGNPTDDIDENDWNRECPGWIYQLVDASPLKIWQYQNAVIGNEEETDDSLRSRRYQLLGNQSVSVLEGLHGSLLNISGIKDVFIINNPNSADMELKAPTNDGTNVLGHSIYIALRYKKGVNLDKSMLGKLIYNKLTPGVGTTPFGYDDGSFDPDADGFESYVIQRTSQISYTIYWKQCQAIKPKIVITLNCNSNYDFPTIYCLVTGSNYYRWSGSSWVDTGSSIQPTNGTFLPPVTNVNLLPSTVGATTEVEKNIVKNLQNYIDEIAIDSYMQATALLNVIQQSDRQKEGVSTFFVKSGTIGTTQATQQNYPANLSYFSYDNSDYKFAYTKSSQDMPYNDICTITIGQ